MTASDFAFPYASYLLYSARTAFSGFFFSNELAIQFVHWLLCIDWLINRFIDLLLLLLFFECSFNRLASVFNTKIWNLFLSFFLFSPHYRLHSGAILRALATEAVASVSGKTTGIVTNTRITHATPAALYAHTPSRYWEDDGKVPPASRKSCKDIARQLIEDDPGRNINVSFITLTSQFSSAIKFNPTNKMKINYKILIVRS